MEGHIVHETEFEVSGRNYQVRVFSSSEGKYYSLTQLGESDVIIIDGKSVQEVLERHRFSLPIAIDCRVLRPERAVIAYFSVLS